MIKHTYYIYVKWGDILDKMNNMDKIVNKKMLDMISNMNEDELRQNLQKVSQVLGNNTTPDMLMQKLKDANIISDKKNN